MKYPPDSLRWSPVDPRKSPLAPLFQRGVVLRDERNYKNGVQKNPL